MSINGPVSRRFIVKNGGAEPPEIGARDDEKEDDGDEAGEIEDGGLCDMGTSGRVCVRVWVCVFGKGGWLEGKCR